MTKIQKKKKTTYKNKKKETRRSNLRFIPALLISVFALFLWSQPNFSVANTNSSDEVLGIATNISIGGLLSSTNVQRAAHSAGALAVNSKLNSAAQAKANDMVARNYWSHQTPDGQQPWVFITNTGYQYLSAGENLAFGFNDSSSTIQGWMNSPSHKANLINKIYTEVGFGIANSNNFVDKGPQTVVVAMYATPHVPKPAPAPAPAPAPKPQVQSSDIRNEDTPTQSPSETPESEELVSEDSPSEENKDKEIEPTIAFADAENNDNQSSTKQIARANIITGKTWTATLVIALVCSSGLLWAIHRGYRLNQVVRNGKEIIGRNIHIDVLILSLIFLAYILLSTGGYIK